MTKLIKNPFLTVVFGNYNAKCQTRCRSNKTSYEGSRLDILTQSHGFNPLINEQVHLIDSSSSYINLISLLNQTLSWSLVFNVFFNQIVIISWNSLFSMYPSIILPLTKKQYGTTTKRILISSGGQLTCLTGLRYYASMMCINKLLFSVTL